MNFSAQSAALCITTSLLSRQKFRFCNCTLSTFSAKVVLLCLHICCFQRSSGTFARAHCLLLQQKWRFVFARFSAPDCESWLVDCAERSLFLKRFSTFKVKCFTWALRVLICLMQVHTFWRKSWELFVQVQALNRCKFMTKRATSSTLSLRACAFEFMFKAFSAQVRRSF